MKKTKSDLSDEAEVKAMITEAAQFAATTYRNDGAVRVAAFLGYVEGDIILRPGRYDGQDLFKHLFFAVKDVLDSRAGKLPQGVLSEVPDAV